MPHERRNMNENNSNDLQTIITQVIEEMKSEQGGVSLIQTKSTLLKWDAVPV